MGSFTEVLKKWVRIWRKIVFRERNQSWRGGQEFGEGQTDTSLSTHGEPGHFWQGVVSTQVVMVRKRQCAYNGRPEYMHRCPSLSRQSSLSMPLPLSPGHKHIFPTPRDRLEAKHGSPPSPAPPTQFSVLKLHVGAIWWPYGVLRPPRFQLLGAFGMSHPEVASSFLLPVFTHTQNHGWS